MRRSDIISGLVLTGFGLVMIFVIVPNQISGSSLYGVAPDVFPRTLIWTTTILAAVLFVSRLVRDYGESKQSPLPPYDWAFIGAATVFLAASVAAVAYLGFVVGGIATVALIMLVMGERTHLLRLGLVSVIAPVVIFYVFRLLFSVYLPDPLSLALP